MKMLRRLAPLFIILIVAGILIPISPIYKPVPTDDPSVYLYVGQRMLEGHAPYLDAWDHKQPLTFFIFALGQLITPHSLWGMWLIELILLSAFAIYGLKLMQKLAPWPAGFLACALTLIGLIPILWGYSLEELALPFQVITLFSLARILETDREAERITYYGLIGVLTAVCFFLKQNLVAAGASVVVYLFLRMISRREWRILRGLAAAAVGFCAVTGLLIAYLTHAGAISAYIDAAFNFNLMYSNLGPVERFNAVLSALGTLAAYPTLFLTFALWIACAAVAFLQAGPLMARWTSRGGFSIGLIFTGAGLILISLLGEMGSSHPGLGLIQILLIAGGTLLLAVGLVLRFKRLREVMSARLASAPLLAGPGSSLRAAFFSVAAIFFPVSLVFMTLSGRDYVYYMIALFPAVMLIIGLGSSLLIEVHPSAQSERSATFRNGVIILVATAVALVYGPGSWLISQYRSEREAQPEIGAYVQQNTSPAQTILVWGKDTTYVYFVSNRKAPSRYFYQAAIALDSYNDRFRAAAELLQEMQKNPPTLFLIPGEPVKDKTCPLSVDNTPNTSGQVFKFICDQFQYAAQASGFQVYRYMAQP